MLPGDDGVVGGGIYLASKPEATRRKAKKKGVILKAKVSLSNAKVITVTGNKQPVTLDLLNAHGYDSVVLVVSRIRRDARDARSRYSHFSTRVSPPGRNMWCTIRTKFTISLFTATPDMNTPAGREY